MKKILVLSDLHIPSRLNKFPLDAIKPYIDKIDIIFGLGDYDSQIGLNNLYGFDREVYAVSGNMYDSLIKSQLPSRLKITIDGINIGLIHGWGGPWGIREKISGQFDNVELICYGHTHLSYLKKENDVFYFNPGSICGPPQSFAILTIDNKKIKANIVEF